MKDFWNHIKSDAMNKSQHAEVISWTCAEFSAILSEKRFLSSSWMWAKSLADIAYSMLMEFTEAYRGDVATNCDVIKNCYECLVRVVGW